MHTDFEIGIRWRNGRAGFWWWWFRMIFGRRRARVLLVGERDVQRLIGDQRERARLGLVAIGDDLERRVVDRRDLHVERCTAELDPVEPDQRVRRLGRDLELHLRD